MSNLSTNIPTLRRCSNHFSCGYCLFDLESRVPNCSQEYMDTLVNDVKKLPSFLSDMKEYNPNGVFNEVIKLAEN